jgi:ABC-type sulfate/molybdate transport systems ATPase subunit
MVRRIEAVLELCGIASLAERSPFALSGGQQQRVALASILVMGPRVLLLDEPTSQLDPLGTKEVFAAIKALSRTGVTVVLVEHKPELIADFADRVVVLNAGQVYMQGPPQTVLAAPEVGELGVTVARYTEAARAGRERGLWPGDVPLPVSLAEAVAGFSTRREPQARNGAAPQPVPEQDRP